MSLFQNLLSLNGSDLTRDERPAAERYLLVLNARGQQLRPLASFLSLLSDRVRNNEVLFINK